MRLSTGSTILGLYGSVAFLPSVLATSAAISTPLGFSPFLRPRFVVRNAIMTHGEPIVFNVCRKHPFGRSVVDYVVSAGTAVEGTDYDASADALSGTMTFEDRELYKTVSIQTLVHGGTPRNRTITCTLSNPQGGVIDNSRATGTIQRGNVTKYTDATALSVIQSALHDALPGDAILLERGGVWTVAGRWTIDRAVGNSANPIILGAYGSGEPPNIQGRLNIRGSHKDGIQTQYLMVQDLHFNGVLCAESTRSYGPKELDFVRMRLWGGRIGMQYGRRADHIRLECSDIKDQVKQGCLGSRTGIEIRYNNFYNNGGIDPVRDWQIYVGYKHCIVEYNICDGNNRTQGIKFKAPINGVCRGNEIKNCYRVGLNTGATGDNICKNNLFEENIIYNNSACLLVHQQTGGGVRSGYFEGLFRNNLFIHGDADRLINNTACRVGENKKNKNNNKNILFYNNTIFIGAGISAAYFGNEEVPGAIWRNNIVVSFGGARAKSVMIYGSATIERGITTSNNIYPADGNVVSVLGVATYTALAAYQAAHPGKEQNSIETDDPQLVETPYDLHIKSGSPAEGTGYDTRRDVPSDIEGNVRSVPVDIGAFRL